MPGPTRSWRSMALSLGGLAALTAGGGCDPKPSSPVSVKAAQLSPSTSSHPPAVTGKPVTPAMAASVAPWVEALGQFRDELNEHGPGRFAMEATSPMTDEPRHVVIDAVVECRWEHSGNAFREIRLTTPDGTIFSPSEIGNKELDKITISGRPVRMTDESGKVSYEGDERLLDYLNWPPSMRRAAQKSDKDVLVIRSIPYRFSLIKPETGTGDRWEAQDAKPRD